MSYVFDTPTLGLTPITSSITPGSGTGPQPAGRSTPGREGNIARAYDPTFGAGEFVYLKATATIPLGSVCLYDEDLSTAALAPATNGVGQLCVAMAAQVSGSYGWFQIQGSAVVLAPNAMAPGAAVYMLAATPGSVDDAVVAGEELVGAVVSTTTGTPGAGFAVVQLNLASLI